MSKRTLIVSAVILLLIGCTSWAVWRHYGVDPKVQAILQKRANMNGPPTPQQREEMRADEKDLTDAQRQQVREVPQAADAATDATGSRRLLRPSTQSANSLPG